MGKKGKIRKGGGKGANGGKGGDGDASAGAGSAASAAAVEPPPGKKRRFSKADVDEIKVVQDAENAKGLMWSASHLLSFTKNSLRGLIDMIHEKRTGIYAARMELTIQAPVVSPPMDKHRNAIVEALWAQENALAQVEYALTQAHLKTATDDPLVRGPWPPLPEQDRKWKPVV